MQNRSITKEFVGFLCRGARTEINLLAANRYDRRPFPLFSGINAPKSTLILFPPGFITAVLSMGAFAKILFSIVEGIVVDMIHRKSIFRNASHDDSVHEDDSSLLPSLAGIVSRVIESATRFEVEPRGFSQDAFVIFGIDKRNLSLTQRNFAIRLFRRGHARNCLRVGFVRCYKHLTPQVYQNSFAAKEIIIWTPAQILRKNSELK